MKHARKCYGDSVNVNSKNYYQFIKSSWGEKRRLLDNLDEEVQVQIVRTFQPDIE